jgi:hypothetical protein
MDNKAKYPRIVGYKLTVNVDWEDGENEDIDISNVEIRFNHRTWRMYWKGLKANELMT